LTWRIASHRVTFAVLLLASGCSTLLPRSLPDEAPPLFDMEEPLELFTEPDDEPERLALDYGSFTGIEVKSAFASLDDEQPEGLLVKHLIENSPADAAGFEEDDLLLVAIGPDGEERELLWPSQWRELELGTKPGEEITVVFDRAGFEGEAVIRPVRRVHPAGRKKAVRFREEIRVGVVLRTATEVEARRADLSPGAGAVIVGLARSSPWRKAGMRYGDLVVEVAGRPVDHPQVVLDAIREGGETIEVTLRHGEEEATVTTALSRRESEVTQIGIPILWEYERDRGETDLSILLGLIKHKTTEVAWEWRILWIIRFSGGDADRLEEVENP